MTIDEALNVLAQVCANTSATLAEHQHIQRAFQVISEALNPADAASQNGDAPLKAAT